MVVSIFFWDGWSFLSFAINLVLVYVLLLLSQRIELTRDNPIWDAIAAFLAILTLSYYTIAVVINSNIASVLDKALISASWIVMSLLIIVIFKEYMRP